MSIAKIGMDCTGCGACKLACPVNCIEWKENREGYCYPLVTDRCIECGKCERVCPALTVPVHQEEKEVYAAYLKDEGKLMQSSSGGIFTAVAEWVLNQGGAVCGCAFDSEMKPGHRIVEEISQLDALKGSKYVESDLGNSYSEVKRLLQQDRHVFFVGTPCQVAGLKNYLGKQYEKLFTADLICHGVPSRTLFRSYLDWRESKHQGKLEGYQFRDKRKHGWSLTYSYTILKKGNRKKRYEGIGSLSPYYHGFLSGVFYRESCYRCRYARPERTGDITLGDFWGVETQCPDCFHAEGVSAILVNSEKGKAMLEQIGRDVVRNPITFDMVVYQNKNLLEPTRRPAVRERIYEEFSQKGFDWVAKTYLKAPHYCLEQVKSWIPNRVRQKIKRMLRK
ncbi:MAG: 4Fe-4S binding protein [Clostridiales bacterium]|nr:4Fe-4S binding protein [Clostridiales bacterium]